MPRESKAEDECGVPPRIGRLRFLFPVCLPLLFGLLAGTSLLTKSATWDETRYLGLGRYILSTGRWDIDGAGWHPPLSYAVHSIPLLFTSVPDDIWREKSGVVRGNRLIALRGDDWILNSCRLVLLPFGIGLVVLVFFWARALYGFWGGVLSASLCAFCPNLLAHAGLITPDVTLTFCFALSAFLLWRRHSRPGLGRLLLCGLSLGLLALSKYTGLLLSAFLLLADLLAGPAAPSSAVRGRLRILRDWLGMGAVAGLLMWAAYGFSLSMPSYAHGLPVPASAYVEGAVFQWRTSHRPAGCFLLGNYSDRGWWYFYVVCLILKLPLGTILLSTLVYPLSRWAGVRIRRGEIYLLVPAVLLLLYLSFLNRIHTGLRYFLPAFPLLFVFLGRIVVAARRVVVLRLGVAASVVCVAASAVATWPHYIPYVNELFGGPKRAHELLSDSNADWGQDLKLLKEYMDEQGIARVQLAYFGTVDPAHYGIEYDYLKSAVSGLPKNTIDRPPADRAPILALSAYQYQGVGFPDRDVYSYFHAYEPQAIIGHSILVFDLRHLVPKGRGAR